MTKPQHEQDLERARRTLKPTDCPRRYCWYWRTLSFEFDIPIIVGCELKDKYPWAAHPDSPLECSRVDGRRELPDYYEPREPHLREDGCPENYFSVLKKQDRKKRAERRRRDADRFDRR